LRVINECRLAGPQRALPRAPRPMATSSPSPRPIRTLAA